MCLPELKIGRIKIARCYEYLKINRLKVKWGKMQKGPPLLMILFCGPDGICAAVISSGKSAI
jgi:hypothetical protein